MYTTNEIFSSYKSVSSSVCYNIFGNLFSMRSIHILTHYITVKHTQLKPLTCGDRVISVYLGQYHGCWCPDSLRRQDISKHDIDYIEYVGPSLTWRSVLSSCGKSIWRNDIKYKQMFMFHQTNLARKGLKHFFSNDKIFDRPPVDIVDQQLPALHWLCDQYRRTDLAATQLIGGNAGREVPLDRCGNTKDGFKNEYRLSNRRVFSA